MIHYCNDKRKPICSEVAGYRKRTEKIRGNVSRVSDIGQSAILMTELISSNIAKWKLIVKTMIFISTVDLLTS